MKNILKLFLTIWLLFSAMSCGEKEDETTDYIHRTEIHYVNETGVSPITLDFYSNNEMKISVSFNNDTSFVATEINDYRWMLPASHDSAIVKFGDMPSKTFIGKNSYQEGVKNPCLRQYYDKEDISNTQRKYTFTFTKDMLE